MADVICQSCQTPNAAGEALCIVCGYELTQETARPPEVVEQTQQCPACGATVPDPTNLVCVDCLEPLSPSEIKLRLRFGDHPVDVPPEGLLLGRDPADSPIADLFTDHDNISRKHATVGVANGQAWVRDENSTNGTFVDDKRVSTGDKASLSHGSTLRMGSNVIAKVELQCPG